MSGSDDDLPDLVGSDEDSPVVEKTNDDYVDIWLRKIKSEKFLEKQENYIRIFSLGPFMFGVNHVLPTPWMWCLRNAGLILNDNREESLSGLDWEEWSLVDIMENVVSIMLKKMRKKHYLVAILNSVEHINGDRLDINAVLDNASKINGIKKLWDRALKSPTCKKKEKETKFAVLYVGKVYHWIVIGLARDCKDVAEEMKKILRMPGVDTVKLKDAGNKEYQRGNFETASRYYTEAARADPLNHIYFGNRAQVNNKLKKFSEALSDSRRAILLKPDWTKGHYRYAQAFYELEKIDMAITVNRKGQEICRASKTVTDNNFKDLVQQGETFKKEREEKLRKDKIRKAVEHAMANENDLPEALKALPGQKRVINLSQAWKLMDDDSNTDSDIPELTSSGSDSSDEEEPPELAEGDSELTKQPMQSVTNRKKGKARKDDIVNTSEQRKTSKNTPVQMSQSVKNNQKDKSKKEETTNKQTKELPVKIQTSTDDKGTKKTSKSNQESQKTMSSSKGNKKQNKLSKKNPEYIEFYNTLKEGSEAYQLGVCKNAVTLYKKALDIVTNDAPLENFGFDEQDLVTLKFACGFAAVSTCLHKFIMEGIEKFEDILKSHQDVKFPLVYYGIGKAYIILNRYPEAISPLKTGLHIINHIQFTVVTWPGTQQKIEEGIPENLRKLMEDMLNVCHYPPVPDAVCKHHTDTEENRTVIYFSDPDFKGFVRMFCKSRCIVEFHNNCWKNYKETFGDKYDKEILDTQCPTPDCQDFICKIITFRQDSNFKEIESDKVHKAPKPRKPLQKLPLSNAYKIERKRERKELRKQRKRECKEEMDDLQLSDKEENGNNNSIPPSIEQRRASNHVVPPEEQRRFSDTPTGATGVSEEVNYAVKEKTGGNKPATVLSKEADDWKLAKYKGVKKHKQTKKKKEKAPTKTVLNLEYNFSDDREKTLLGEDAADEEEQIVDQRSKVPPRMHNTHHHHHAEKPQVVAVEPLDECTETLLTFFEDMLRENGPMHIQDTVISSMLEEFPQEAKQRIDKVGGLGNFLQKSSKFALVDGIVCLLKDASKARDIALARKTNVDKMNVGQSQFKKETNPWKTIGKGPSATQHANNSDFPSISNQVSISSESSNSVTSFITTDRETKTISNSDIGSIDDIDDVSLPTESFVVSTKNIYDSLDDFSPPGKKTNVNNIDMMDSIDDIPLYTSSKKVKKKHLDDSDDLRSTSDSESVHSGNVSDVLKLDKIDYYKNEKFSGDQGSNLSRSSSRSDLSEQSDLSAELMAKAYKQPNRQSPLVSPAPSKPSWPEKERIPATVPGFGPIGSPVPTSIEKGFDAAVSKPLPSPGLTLHQEVTAATEKEIRKIDMQLVNELAAEVVDQMYFGKSVSDSQRNLTFDRVARDIWSDFKHSTESSSFPISADFMPGSPFGNVSNKNSVNAGEFSRNKKSYAEQFMKNHYQQKMTTDPTGLGERFLSPFPISQGFSPVSTNNIWSNTPTVNRMTAPNFSHPPMSSFSKPPPPLTLPSSKTNPFGNISIGTSISAPLSQSADSSTHFPSFSSPYTIPGINNASTNHLQSAFVCSQATQVAVETKSMETNTEPYEPYKEEYIRAREERDYFEKSLKDATSQLQEITSLLQQRDHRCKTLEANMMQESQKMNEEREQMKKNQEQITKEVTALQEAVTLQREAELDQLKMIAELENKIAELVKAHNEDSEMKQIILNEKVDALKNKEEFRKNFEQELERAKSAEIEVLKSKLGYAMQMLQRSHKEAVFYTKNLADMIKKREDTEQQIPKRMHQTLDHYKNISQKCEETITRLNSEFETQIQQIQSGQKLADLPQIFIPPPPPPPPMNFMQQDMAGGMNQTNPNSVPQLAALAQASASSTTDTTKSLPMSASAPNLIPTSASSKDDKPQQPKPLVPPPGLQARAITTSTSTQPRQPAPLSAAQGIVPPRPTSFVRPMNASLVAGVVSQAPKNSFEKLISRLQVAFPKYNRAVFTRLVQELRASRGNSLSGMTLDEIVQHITDLIHSYEQRQNLSFTEPVTSVPETPATVTNTQELTIQAKPVAPPPSTAPASGLQSTTADSGNSQNELFEEEEDPCVICHEEMASQPCVTLDCKHRFHDECIRKWLKEQSTCPNCRIHALLPDEFPSLK